MIGRVKHMAVKEGVQGHIVVSALLLLGHQVDSYRVLLETLAIRCKISLTLEMCDFLR